MRISAVSMASAARIPSPSTESQGLRAADLPLLSPSPYPSPFPTSGFQDLKARRSPQNEAMRSPNSL
eukprot:9331199-Pyramimonas_sp.AAC.1